MCCRCRAGLRMRTRTAHRIPRRRWIPRCPRLVPSAREGVVGVVAVAAAAKDRALKGRVLMRKALKAQLMVRALL